MPKTLICLAATVFALSAADHPNFKSETIDDNIQIGYGLAIADVNGDGKEDILLADKQEIVWYENPGWKRHVMAANLTVQDNVCIAAQDIDGDGKAEVAVGAGWNPGDTVNSGAVFFLEAPRDRKKRWKPVQLPHEPTVHRMWWVRTTDGYSLVVAPLHGRGNKGGQGDPVKLIAYSKPKNPGGEWKQTVIDRTMHMTHNLDPVSWDSDHAQEILYCGKEGVLLLDQARNGGEWTGKQLIGAEKNPGFPGAGEVRAGQRNGTKFISTIEPMHGNNLVVYSSEGSAWKRQVIDDTYADGHAIATGTVLDSARDQIVAGWRGKNAEGKVGIKIYTFDGSQWNGEWIDNNGMACEDLKRADLNGDDRLDIIAAGRATKNVKIYWNKGK